MTLATQIAKLALTRVTLHRELPPDDGVIGDVDPYAAVNLPDGRVLAVRDAHVTAWLARIAFEEFGTVASKGVLHDVIVTLEGLALFNQEGAK